MIVPRGRREINEESSSIAPRELVSVATLVYFSSVALLLHYCVEWVKLLLWVRFIAVDAFCAFYQFINGIQFLLNLLTYLATHYMHWQNKANISVHIKLLVMPSTNSRVFECRFDSRKLLIWEVWRSGPNHSMIVR